MSALSEFALIERFFAPLRCEREGVLSIGDDAALWPQVGGQHQAICTDTLVAGRHFMPDADPADIAWKALAVNISDLLAMGAQPQGYLLALTLPRADARWLSGFAEGLRQAQRRWGVCLLGGDTTGGDRTVVTITAMGRVSMGRAWKRSGAQPGDRIWLSGPVGDAALGLKALLGEFDAADMPACVQAQVRPRPPDRLAQWLQRQDDAVHAAIDISDGLAQDLGHVARLSGVDCRIELAHLPVSSAVAAWCRERRDWSLPLAGGEDYQLLWTAPFSWRPHNPPQAIFPIGRAVGRGAGRVEVVDEAGRPVPLAQSGFLHFR